MPRIEWGSEETPGRYRRQRTSVCVEGWEFRKESPSSCVLGESRSDRMDRFSVRTLMKNVSSDCSLSPTPSPVPPPVPSSIWNIPLSLPCPTLVTLLSHQTGWFPLSFQGARGIRPPHGHCQVGPSRTHSLTAGCDFMPSEHEPIQLAPKLYRSLGFGKGLSCTNDYTISPMGEGPWKRGMHSAVGFSPEGVQWGRQEDFELVVEGWTCFQLTKIRK